ncbi:ubiquitin carboxyl-terminal hydrolase 16/45 [Amyelois transitella]|uniref:ubiquitin carboxyl-terminal hydrolase 16/45 n=1 Tax=Amyelois transitella TaxID=680683 RepID=UPI00298FAAEE|nr:ubiquitin carboxyl-terminal hydrolase 16/45 [Amyelois transitella]
MVKKKKASDPTENGDDSTESCDENVKSACPHIAKSVFLVKLKKCLKAGGFEKECSECKAMTKTEVCDPDFEEDLTLWMCLRCGSQLCGRARNKHALEHYKKAHSDPHSVTVNTTTWEVHCYDCDNEVPVSSSRKLNECIEFLKKQVVVEKPKPLPPIELYFESRKVDLGLPVENLIKTDKLKDKATSMNLPRVRGLTNLGNTCFFNSVMQCLVQTPYLLQVLQEMATPGERFTLPGGKLKLKVDGDAEGKEVDLPPITGQLAEWGTLTRTLAETLAELQAGEGGVYTPRKLLSALVNKLPQFDGGEQHDAHELLRHLLEAVRSEDLRRYQSVILSSLGMSSKVDPAKVDGEVKQKVKFYGQQASDTMLRPEQVFRGFLVSTLECQDCFNQSDRAEYFLDLSLPVAACRPQPPAVLRRKTPNDENTYNTQEENKPSKHQLKKEKKRRAHRRNTSGHAAPKEESPAAEAGTNGAKDDGKSSSEQSDADVEDNLEDVPRRNDTHTSSVGSQAIAHTASNFAAYHMSDSTYNYDKLGNTTHSTYRTSPVDLDKEKNDNTPECADKDKCVTQPPPRFPTLQLPCDYKRDNAEDNDNVDTKPVSDTASNFAAYHLTYDLKEKSDNTPENADKVELVDSSTSTVAIPLEYKPLISLENLSNPDSGVASPETTKHNSTETVDNVDSPINGKELGSHSSLSSEINLDLSSPQHNNLSPDKDFETPESEAAGTKPTPRTELERPASRRSFAMEYSNEVVSRGISVQGCKNVLEHSGESSYESLPENKNLVINDLHNYYQNIANKVDELKLIMEDSKNSKAQPSQPSPVAAEPEPERGTSARTTFRPRTTALEPKVYNVDVNKKETNTNDYLYSRPTLSSPYVCEEDECSIQSCLSQFTALELLTGNNKVGCDNCTERINGKDGKTVYTNATKRFLVSSPPAILILHLKRFQIGPRCMFRKMSKHVDFPTILDLAPFCAMDKLKKLPNVARGQNELLYSLYGVVEHSGGMHGGHYVAYVKVRQPVRAGDPRWWFLPKSANIPAASANGDGDADSESDLSGYESGEGPGSAAEAPSGKWYYISDSMVTEVTEDKVLNAQAYLLFYERIY